MAHFAPCHRIIGIKAHERREVEGDAEARLALCQEILEASIRIVCGAETGELPHGPEAAAIHARVDAAGVGE